MYQSGSEIPEVLTAINRAVIKRKEESDNQTEEIAPEPTPSQNIKEVYNIEIKATEQEFEAIERYLKSNGIHFELTTNDDLPW